MLRVKGKSEGLVVAWVAMFSTLIHGRFMHRHVKIPRHVWKYVTYSKRKEAEEGKTHADYTTFE